MRGRASFEDLRRNGVRGRSGAVGVSFVPSGNDVAEVGYAVTRRVGNAVVRNKLRRRLRGAFHELAQTGDSRLRAGRYVVSPSPAAALLPYRDLAEALRGALERASRRVAPVESFR